MMQDAEATGEVYVALFEISHPSLDKPVRLSTDNADLISEEPYIRGTRSNWRGANTATDPYLWIIASTLMPSDLEDAPAAGTLILENLDADIVNIVRSYTDMATVAMAVVLASSPNMIEGEWTDMKIKTAEINASEITLTFSREEIELEYYPAGRMVNDLFPGLFL